MSTPETSGRSWTRLYSSENARTSLVQTRMRDPVSLEKNARAKLKVLLVQPPVQDFYDTDVRLQPIGLASLKAAVKKHLPHVEVIIKDYHAGCGRRTVAIPDELRDLMDYYHDFDMR